MIVRRRQRRRQRRAGPYLRGAQDFVIFGETENPFRPGSISHAAYLKGFSDAAVGRYDPPSPVAGPGGRPPEPE